MQKDVMRNSKLITYRDSTAKSKRGSKRCSHKMIPDVGAEFFSCYKRRALQNAKKPTLTLSQASQVTAPF